jgi:hypothetical protein
VLAVRALSLLLRDRSLKQVRCQGQGFFPPGAAIVPAAFHEIAAVPPS